MKCFAAVVLVCLVGLTSCLPWTVLHRRNASNATSRQTFSANTAKQAVNSSQFQRLAKRTQTLFYYYQKLDHFDIHNDEIWLQRFWIDVTYFNGSGPVFLIVSGTQEATTSMITDSQIANTASIYNAMIVLVEHRYFGDSIPTDDLSLDNLAYLTVEQALEDLADIRNSVHNNMNLTYVNKWMAYGSGYGGNLAAWFRLKFSNLVNGAVVFSAEVGAQFEAPNYFPNVAQIINNYDQSCVQAIQKASNQLIGFIKQNRPLLQTLFGTCSPITNLNDITLLLYQNAAIFATSAEFYNTNVLPTKLQLASACQIMKDTSIGDELYRYAYYILEYIYSSGSTCQEATYSNFVAELANIYDLTSGLRPTMYLHCNQLGGFITTFSGNHPFGHDVWIQFWVGLCNDAFGYASDIVDYNASMSITNIVYDGTAYQGSIVSFVSGKVDPSNDLYVTTTSNAVTNNPNIETLEITNTGAFYDFSSLQYTSSVVRTIIKINSMITQYIIG